MISALHENWNEINRIDTGLCKFDYDSTGNLISLTCSVKGEITWINQWCEIYTYDNDKKLTSNTYKFWDGNNWVNNRRESYEYDLSKNMTSLLVQYSDNDVWSNFSKNVFAYDGNGNNIIKLVENWVDNSWATMEYDSLIYDNDEKLEITVKKIWDGEKLRNYFRESYIYDSNGNMSSKLKENWNEGSWKKSLLNTYSYDLNGNMELWLLEIHNDENRENVNRIRYEYNQNNNLTSLVSEKWLDSSWTEFEREIELDIFNDNYIRNNYSGTSFKFYYGIISNTKGFDKIPSSISLMQNFPNPFNPSTTIKFSIPKASDISIKLYDVLGREVKTLFTDKIEAGLHSLEFDASDLPSGVYFYSLGYEEYSLTKKLLLLK
jgi:hypothetical protein